MYKLALGPTQPPTQWALGALTLRSWDVKLTTHLHQEHMELYLHSPILPHGVVFN